jgi:hypothetical protein
VGAGTLPRGHGRRALRETSGGGVAERCARARAPERTVPMFGCLVFGGGLFEAPQPERMPCPPTMPGARSRGCRPGPLHTLPVPTRPPPPPAFPPFCRRGCGGHGQTGLWRGPGRSASPTGQPGLHTSWWLEITGDSDGVGPHRPNCNGADYACRQARPCLGC